MYYNRDFFEKLRREVRSAKGFHEPIERYHGSLMQFIFQLMVAGEKITSLIITYVYVSFYACASENIRYFANYKLFDQLHIYTIKVNIFPISSRQQIKYISQSGASDI